MGVDDGGVNTMRRRGLGGIFYGVGASRALNVMRREDVGEHGDALNVMRRGGLDGIFYGVRASQDPCCCSSS